jgi:hypothetical protein
VRVLVVILVECGSNATRIPATIPLCLTEVSSYKFRKILLLKTSPFITHSLVIFKIASAAISGCL